ncbi:MAG: hypothetical protein H0W36_01720 [Gemmatimonadetes bacterium]|nr:hypothetical protein [Gemmatimonadota bacterium]
MLRSTFRPTHALAPAAALLLLLLLVACGHRILGFGDARRGILLVRHTEAEPQVVWVSGVELGIAQSGGITCFREVPTGSVRIEARPVSAAGDGGFQGLTRATEITLPPEQPLLWDIDQDQGFSGRAHARLCEENWQIPPRATDQAVLAHWTRSAVR